MPRALATLCAVLLLAAGAGCGGGTATPKGPAFPLSHTEVPPAGVPERTSATSDPAATCTEPDARPATRPPSVRFNALPAGRPRFETAGRRLHLGDLIAVCVSDYRSDLPIDAAVTSSGGSAVRHRWPAGTGANRAPWVALAADRIGPGRHRLTVSQDGVPPRSFDFEVDGTSPHGGLWTDAAYAASAGSPITIGSGANPPGSDVRFDFYVADSEGRFSYRTSVKAKADQHGAALVVVPTRAADAHRYLVMQRGSPAAPTSIDLVGTVVGGPARRATDAPPRSLFQAHDAPPRGVARQFAYYEEGGPGGCPSPATGRPAVVLAREQPRYDDSPQTGSQTRFEIGDRLRACAYNFTKGRAATLTIQGPAGARGTRTLPAAVVGQDIGSTLLIAPDAPEGAYRLTVRQAGKAASTRMTLRAPAVPGYLATTAADGEPEVLVVGLPPHQRFWLSLYRPPTHAPFDSGVPQRLAAGFVAGVSLRADARGIAIRELRTAPGDPKGCFVTKVSYGRHVLDDLDNTLSLICGVDRSGPELVPEPTL